MNHQIRKRDFLRLLGWGGVAATVGLPAAARAAHRSTTGMTSVHEFGAHGDGKRLDTQSIQKAIEACAKAGGGTVFFPAGTYLSGTIFLRNRVSLHLDSGATLLGSKDLADYPSTIPALRSFTDRYTERSLIYAEKIEQTGITGRGTIDGQGPAFSGEYKVRPFLLRFVACRDVSVTGITLQNSAMWVQHYLGCDDVHISGLRVRSRENLNNDGIDIDACHRVRISDCDIAAKDDAIVLKSTLRRACYDVVITNCVLLSDCNAFKLGTESIGGFHDITMINCVIHDTRLAGIALQAVDGGQLKRVSISNITMRRTGTAIAIRLGNRGLGYGEGRTAPLSELSGINISDVQAATTDIIGCSITGLPGQRAEDITLDNVRITYAGGGQDTDAQAQVPEHPGKYPAHSMFGRLPAYGFYCRHVRGVRFRNVRLDVAEPDHRPAFICDEAEDLEFVDCAAASASQNNPLLHFQNVSNALIRGWRARGSAKTFLRVTGADSTKIRLTGNDPEITANNITLGEEAPKDAVHIIAHTETPLPSAK